MKIFHVILLVFLFQFSAVAQSENKNDENGKKHGLWKGYYDESKRVKYEGTFDHGKETGIFKFYDDTKAHTVIATRDFSRGKNSAYTTFFDGANIVSEGNIVNKLYEGKWTYYHQRSKQPMTVEHYTSGKLNGKRTVFYPDGKIAEETNYKNDIKEGAYKKFSPKGIVLEEATYVSNQFHGPAVYRAPDGNIVAKGNYKNGAKNGYWEFYENGKLASKEKYPIRKKTGKPKTK